MRPTHLHCWHSVVANERVGEDEDLALVGRVGQRLGVAHHARLENWGVRVWRRVSVCVCIYIACVYASYVCMHCMCVCVCALHVCMHRMCVCIACVMHCMCVCIACVYALYVCTRMRSCVYELNVCTLHVCLNWMCVCVHVIH